MESFIRFTALFATVFGLFLTVQTRSLTFGSQVIELLEPRERKNAAKNEDCAYDENLPIHTVMENICAVCHEHHSHELANLRSDCRADCFDNSIFRDCLKFVSRKDPIEDGEPEKVKLSRFRKSFFNS
ncbi:unnamed protein product [Caenorhabditis auriculariae]|uniref:Uncharacterized protein n=1 Tax=Caenorhabditis auriculariae TaxID=2777116 RepID=A0A8S1GP42_9PELO|nr:unnamed protein product [Caenorhabditis auriculariae]